MDLNEKNQQLTQEYIIKLHKKDLIIDDRYKMLKVYSSITSMLGSVEHRIEESKLNQEAIIKDYVESDFKCPRCCEQLSLILHQNELTILKDYMENEVL